MNSADPYYFQGKDKGDNSINANGIFFYHVPKTGGITLYSSILYSLKYILDTISLIDPGIDLPMCDRVDPPEPLPEGTMIKGNYLLVATHQPFGLHEKLSGNLSLITVFREPFKRVLSSYTYGCMRDKKQPNANEFVEFFQLEINKNVSIKLLSGIFPSGEIAESHMEKSLTVLDKNFLLFGTTKHIETICEQLLCWNFLPNVVIDHMNKTEPEYLFDGSEFEEEIRDLNRFDNELFEYVKINPRLNIPGVEKGEPHKSTVMVKEVSNVDASTTQWTVAPSRLISPYVKDARFPRDIFDECF